MSGSSAAWPVAQAVGAALNVDAALATLCRKNTVGAAYFAGEVPEGLDTPYVVLGEQSETGFPVFHREGHDNVLRMHVFASTKEAVLRIYRAVVTPLHLVRLALDDHDIVRGTVRLLDSFRDPTGGWHGVAIYEVITQEKRA